MQNTRKHRVALGFGNNVDYEIEWNGSLIENLCRQYQISSGDIHEYREVIDERELLCSILFHLAEGSGKEIYISESDIVETFSRRFTRRVTMGGTAIRAALAMSRMGAASALHLVTMNDAVRACLPEECSYICSSEQDSSYPHLIVQFKTGDRISTDQLEITAPMANRIIYTNDPDNASMHINEKFIQLLDQARIMLVSGFNVIENAQTLKARLEKVRRIAAALPGNTVVFSESGCYFEEEMQWRFLRELGDIIDIYSMNEEEMQLLLKRRVNLLNAKDMASALETLHRAVGTRYVLVHAHCWAVLYGKGAGRYSRALESAVTMATTRFRFGDAFSKEQYASTRDLPVPEERRMFISEIQELLGKFVCVKPVGIVSETEVTTIGLGDSFVGGFMLPFAEN